MYLGGIFFRNPIDGVEVELLDARATSLPEDSDDEDDERGVARVIDGNPSTYWSDYNMDSVVVSFPVPVAMDAFALQSSSEYSDADPVEFSLHAAGRGVDSEIPDGDLAGWEMLFQVGGCVRRQSGWLWEMLSDGDLAGRCCLGRIGYVLCVGPSSKKPLATSFSHELVTRENVVRK